MAYQNSIIIFGAGRIGRSFIGQLFGLSGYQVVFVDVDRGLVDALNQRKSYPVVIKSDAEEVIMVPNVRAVHALELDKVAREMAGASLLAVSVGKNALVQIIPLLAGGIKARYLRNPDLPLDIIIAENMRDASGYMREQLVPLLPPEYPVDRLLGLVETSIGKMVPIIPESDARKDPLRVFAEPYNELILDRTAFRGKIPDIQGLAPKENIRAWVDRKAFVHNLGHATAAYVGAYHHPEAKYIYEVLQDEKVYTFTRKVMLQASEILLTCYPRDFTREDLGDHIDDLLKRFQNRALGDTVFRVGQDLHRKLGRDDRFMGIIRMALQLGMDHGRILEAMVFGFFFRGKDEHGNMYPPDVTFAEDLSRNLDETLERICGLHPGKDQKIIEECKPLYDRLKVKFTGH